MSQRRKKQIVHPPAKESPRPSIASIKEPPKRPWALLALFAFVGACIALVFLNKPTQPAAKSVAFLANGARNNCKAAPGFVTQLGLSGTPSLSTSERDLLGLAVVTHDPMTQQRAQYWQHPSWRSAGNLSAFAIDARGDIYALPAPRVNLLDNPPALQNRLYRVDSQSGVMQMVLEFPVAAKVDQRNPYAGLSVSYDCGLDSLYLSSVAGASPREELGKVFRIALKPAPHIASTLEHLDILSLLSVDTPNGIALLMGSARNSKVLSLALAANGNFIDGLRPTAIFDLAGLGPEGNDRARKIELGADASIQVRGMRFAYNLAQPPAQTKPTSYRFVFDLASQRYQPARPYQ